MGYFFLEYDHEQSFNFDTKKDKEKSVSWREFFCKYNGVIFICFDRQFILNRHKKKGGKHFVSWDSLFSLFILHPGNCLLLVLMKIVVFLLFLIVSIK